MTVITDCPVAITIIIFQVLFVASGMNSRILSIAAAWLGYPETVLLARITYLFDRSLMVHSSRRLGRSRDYRALPASRIHTPQDLASVVADMKDGKP